MFEIDDTLLEVARAQLGYVLDERTEVVIGDARVHLGDLESSSHDVVVGDAFGGAAVPWHLTTVEFLDEVVRVLRPDGVYLLNVIDGGDNAFAEWQARTLLDRFAHVEVIAPVEGVDQVANQILLASAAPIQWFALGGDGEWVGDVAAFAEDGQVLTDDHAPVDQLLTTR